MKIAVIHDWLTTYAGSERVLEQILKLFPEADLYSTVDFIKDRTFIMDKKVHTSFIQRLPFARGKFRTYLPLMPIAVEQFDLSQYKLIISSSHAVAKGVITGPEQLHISYVHSPIRYAWDLQSQYLKESGLDKGLKGILAKWILYQMRNWDYRTANGVDYFAANSSFIAKRIWKVYRRKSQVIYPPVDIEAFEFSDKKEDFYFTASRMVPYKKIDTIVDAFSKMPNKRLIVIGDGPDFKKIRAKASSNVTLMGYQPFSVLRDYMQRARAFVFAAEEDFGIIPVEAQACGTPVIAYGKGGVRETVKCLSECDNPTGLFYNEQTAKSICEAVKHFETNSDKIKSKDCRQQALRFSPERFRSRFSSFVQEKLNVGENFMIGEVNDEDLF